MYRFDNNKIYLVRGDTLEALVSIKQDGEEYIPAEGDVIRFALKHSDFNPKKSQYVDKEPLILKVIPNDTLLLELTPEDTSQLDFGSYDYDVQITMGESGKVDTFISNKLILEPEVH